MKTSELLQTLLMHFMTAWSHINEGEAIASRMLSLMNTLNGVRVLETQMDLNNLRTDFEHFKVMPTYFRGIPQKYARVFSIFRIRPANHRLRLLPVLSNCVLLCRTRK